MEDARRKTGKIVQSDEISGSHKRPVEVAKTFEISSIIRKTANLYGENKLDTKIGIVQGGEISVLSVQAVDFPSERQYHKAIKSEQIRINKN